MDVLHKLRAYSQARITIAPAGVANARCEGAAHPGVIRAGTGTAAWEGRMCPWAIGGAAGFVCFPLRHFRLSSSSPSAVPRGPRHHATLQQPRHFDLKPPLLSTRRLAWLFLAFLLQISIRMRQVPSTHSARNLAVGIIC